MSFHVNKLFFKNFQFILACILLTEGFSFLICSSVAIVNNELIIPFLIPGLVAVAVGLLLYSYSAKKILPLADNRKKFVLISFTLIIAILTGTLPYLTGHYVSSFSNAFFESTSGFTLTGSTVFPNIDQLPRSIVLWRSLSHWIGGFGTILLAVQIFPFMNVFGNKPYSSGIYPHDNSLFSFKNVLKRILLIYSIVTVVGTSLLWLGGIGFFNSVCYAMGTVSSGCFSPETSGIASYSPFIQYLLVVLMGLSGIGYFAFILIASGRIRYLVKNNDELKLFGLIILSATLILTIIFFTKDGFTTENAFRCGLFQAVSFLSSSGFSMYNYIESTENVVLIMMILAIIGGCLGSTSGGIKVNRLSLILKNLKCSFYQLNDFSTSNGLKYNREMIDERTNISVLSFVALFGIITVVGILVLILTGISPSKSAFLVVTSITSIGHNLNMSDYSSSIKIILSILMLIGRLEIYPVLLLLLPSFYRNGNSKNNLR